MAGSAEGVEHSASEWIAPKRGTRRPRGSADHGCPGSTCPTMSRAKPLGGVAALELLDAAENRLLPRSPTSRRPDPGT